MCDPWKIAYEKKVYLTDWVNKAKSVQNAVPKVQEQLDLAAWEESVLCDIPEQEAKKVPADITTLLSQDLETVRRVLPKIPQIDLPLVCISTAATSTTSTVIYQVTESARHSDNHGLRKWGDLHSQAYEALQSRLGREEEVRNLLLKLTANLAKEFDDAASAYKAAAVNMSTLPNVGIAMRNVLEHFKGELMNLARRPHEQKIEWNQIAERLVEDIETARQRFMMQEVNWNDLHDRLTKLAKSRIRLDKADLVSIFTEFLDHLYIVLSLVRINQSNS
jgi:hypothetical protein